MIFSFSLKSNKYLLMQHDQLETKTKQKKKDTVANTNNYSKFIYNLNELKPTKYLKRMWLLSEGMGSPGSALSLHSKPWPRGAAGAARSLVGTDQQESEFCILHKSGLSSGQSDCIWDQPTVLHETVSPHLCLAVFPCPAVNKAGWGLSASPPARGDTSQPELAGGLRAHVRVPASRQPIQRTPGKSQSEATSAWPS